MEHRIGIDKITEFTNHAVKSELFARDIHFTVKKMVLRFLTIHSLNILFICSLDRQRNNLYYISYSWLLYRKTNDILRTSTVLFKL